MPDLLASVRPGPPRTATFACIRLTRSPLPLPAPARLRARPPQRKSQPDAAARLGCEHCEAAPDGCPHCWKDLLAWLGDGAARGPPPDKVAAAMATPQPEDGSEVGGGSAAPEAAQQAQQAAQQAQQAGAPLGGEAVKWGGRISNWHIKCGCWGRCCCGRAGCALG